METLVETLRSLPRQLEEIVTQYNNYLKHTTNEEYVAKNIHHNGEENQEMKTMIEEFEDEIIRGEGILDRVNEMQTRNCVLLETCYDFTVELTKMKCMVDGFVTMNEDIQKQIERKRNGIQRELNVVIERRNEWLGTGDEERRNDWNGMNEEVNQCRRKKNENEMKKKNIEMMKWEDVLQLQGLLEMTFDSVVFDSDKDNWAKYMSVFDTKVFEKEKLAFVI